MNSPHGESPVQDQYSSRVPDTPVWALPLRVNRPGEEAETPEPAMYSHTVVNLAMSSCVDTSELPPIQTGAQPEA